MDGCERSAWMCTWGVAIVIIFIIVVTISTCALLWTHTLANIIQEHASSEYRAWARQFSHVKGNDGVSVQNEEPLLKFVQFHTIIYPPLMCVFLVEKHTTDLHKSLSSSFQLGQEMTHVGRQRLISVYPRVVEPVRVYLTGQALKWRSNKPVKWYYHRNMIDQLNSIRDSGQWD